MIVAFTGHRPPKAGLTYSHDAEGDWEAVSRVMNWATDWPDAIHHFIVGGALGFDTLAARAAMGVGLPYVVYVPFVGQSSVWPASAQARYQLMLDNADGVNIVCEGGYSPEKMQIRNMAMVNDADVMVAWWDGSPGGTSNCVQYAQQRGIKVINLWDT